MTCFIDVILGPSGTPQIQLQKIGPQIMRGCRAEWYGKTLDSKITVPQERSDSNEYVILVNGRS